MQNAIGKYQVIKPYESPYPEPLIFTQGEAIEILKEYTKDPDWKDWLWCKGLHDNEAWIPKQFIDLLENKGTMLRDYNALELTVSVGEALLVSEIINGFAIAEKADGTEGWVPMRNLEFIDGEV